MVCEAHLHTASSYQTSSKRCSSMEVRATEYAHDPYHPHMLPFLWKLCLAIFVDQYTPDERVWNVVWKTESIFQASYVSPPTCHTLKGGVVLQYFPQWISCSKWLPVHETIKTQSILLTAVHKCYWGQMVDVRTLFSTASSDLSGGRASAKSVVFRVTGFLLLPPLPPLPTLPSPPCSCGAVSERLWCFFIKFFLPGFQMSTGEKVTSSWPLLLFSSSSSSSSVIWTKLNGFLTLCGSLRDLHNDKEQANCYTVLFWLKHTMWSKWHRKVHWLFMYVTAAYKMVHSWRHNIIALCSHPAWQNKRSCLEVWGMSC